MIQTQQFNCQPITTMNSFQISASNVTYEERSFNTLQLLTQSRELSPIQQLKGSLTSDMKPQILFQSANHYKVSSTRHIPLLEGLSEAQQSYPRSPHPYHNLLANQQIYESFEIQSPFPSPAQQVEQQNLLDDCDSDGNDSLFDSSASKNHSGKSSCRIPIQMSVSRHLYVGNDGAIMNSNLCLNRFLSQFKELQSNIQKLQNVIDKIKISQSQNQQIVSFKKGKQNRMQVQQILPMEGSVPRKAHSRMKIDSIEAKSTQSEEVVMTPDRCVPFVTEFDLPSDLSRFRIDDLSPISSAKKKEKSLNVDESSSSILMKKKFSRRIQAEFL